MISYQILVSAEEKQRVKTGFQSLFASVFERALDDASWEHQFIHSPYDDSPLFLAMDEERVVGSALMIRQKHQIGNEQGEYYLYTTSAIQKEYRAHGVYAELLKRQKTYAVEQQVDFIFAFPNKIAHQVLKLFGGFKDLRRVYLVKSTLSNLRLDNHANSLKIDSALFNWRFEHKPYKFAKLNEQYVAIYKIYNGVVDVLAIYPEEELSAYPIEYTELGSDVEIITLNENLINAENGEVTETLNATYFPIGKASVDKTLPLNLLMSDVF